MELRWGGVARGGEKEREREREESKINIFNFCKRTERMAHFQTKLLLKFLMLISVSFVPKYIQMLS